MAPTSTTTSVSASTTVTAASILSSSANHRDWGSKVCIFLLSVRESSWGIFPLLFICLVQHIKIIFCAGIVLLRLYYGAPVIFLGFELGSLFGFTLIFVQMLTWGSKQYMSSLTNLGLTRIWLEYLFINSSWSGRSDVGLVLFHWRLGGLIVDSVELSVTLYCIMC